MRPYPIVAIAVGLLLLVLAVAGCNGGAGGATQLTVTATEYQFDPSIIRVQQGERVVLTLQNRGAIEHNLHIPDLNVATPDVQPGQSARVEFTPERTGTFGTVCTIPGHAEAGMVGQLVVQ